MTISKLLTKYRYNSRYKLDEINQIIAIEVILGFYPLAKVQ